MRQRFHVGGEEDTPNVLSKASVLPCWDLSVWSIAIKQHHLDGYLVQFSGDRCGSSAAVRRNRKDTKHCSWTENSVSLEFESSKLPCNIFIVTRSLLS